MSETPLNGALIGAGNVTSFHLQGWQRISQASIVAIAEPDLKKAQTRAREFGIDSGRVFASLSDLLRAGVVLDINENWRWRPWYRTIKQMISQGEFGRPVYARVFAHGPAWLPNRVRPRNHRVRTMQRAAFFSGDESGWQSSNLSLDQV